MLWHFIVLSTSILSAYAASRTSPPSGAIVVNPSTSTSGQFKTVSSAIASLPNDATSQTIFIFPGTYKEQVLINRPGPVTLLGYTTNTMDFSQNQAVITNSLSEAQTGSDDESGTLRIKSNNVALYNIDVRNDFGVGSQAIAVSAYGSQFGAYACRFFSYQDTLLAQNGMQVYLMSYIEGAVDYIFGQHARAWFESNTLASKGAGCITANGRSDDSDQSIYVFNKNNVVAASDAFSNVTGKTFLGRPWRDYARVVFLNSNINLELDKGVWSEWSSSMPNTDHILFAEYNSQGSGVANAARPSFVTILSSSEASQYTISSTLGSNYTSWVDQTYLS
ncbi:carbohydrate esterase family 8 protein [Fomitiporia mediterranea MF3/22]|uniref:carbohydrate esterase family 8 protein n=1 Tax=Fomitiporia mediterranea (strain MF3/22) TaxID=694068 RepID=UPI0004407B9A|nr:carbohydrate esterase family 8 protein [Fomitiporia mediterranea MF3/22]EJD03927.1 carbohydrate esterase family 8 protein [Fomitiporia mediterranea MF3/22]